MRFIIKYYLFLLAYLPLYLIVAVKSINKPFYDEYGKLLPISSIVENNLLSTILIGLFVFLTLTFLLYTRYIFKANKGNRLFKIAKINSQDEKYIEYLGTYILPFIALETKDIFDTTAFALMFLTLGYIYIKTNLIYTNPALTFFKYDLIQITTEDGKTYDCLTKNKFEIGDEPTGKKLSTDTFIIRPWTPQLSKN